MPTLNPRITVTVTPRVAAALSRFSQVTGRSQSAMVGEILEESVPMMTKMIKVIEAAKSVESTMAASLMEPFETAQAHIEKQLGLSLDAADAISSDLLADVEAIGRRSARAKKVGSRAIGPAPTSPITAAPPLSNRGGKPVRVGKGQKAKSLNSQRKGKK